MVSSEKSFNTQNTLNLFIFLNVFLVSLIKAGRKQKTIKIIYDFLILLAIKYKNSHNSVYVSLLHVVNRFVSRIRIKNTKIKGRICSLPLPPVQGDLNRKIFLQRYLNEAANNYTCSSFPLRLLLLYDQLILTKSNSADMALGFQKIVMEPYTLAKQNKLNKLQPGKGVIDVITRSNVIKKSKNYYL